MIKSVVPVLLNTNLIQILTHLILMEQILCIPKEHYRLLPIWFSR